MPPQQVTSLPSLGDGPFAMIIAVRAVQVVQRPIDEVIEMVSMRHRFMAATGTVDVRGVMAAAGV